MKNLLYLLIVLSVVYNCGSDYEDPALLALEDDYGDWAKSEFEDDNGDLILDDGFDDLSLDDDFDDDNGDLILDDDFDDLSLDDDFDDEDNGLGLPRNTDILFEEYNKVMPKKITYDFKIILFLSGADKIRDK